MYVKGYEDIRISRAICAPRMIALRAAQLSALERGLRSIDFKALTTGPPDTLSNLLVHQFLATRLPRPPQNDFLAGVVIPVWHNNCICCAFSQDLVPALSTGFLLCLGSLRRVVSALAASAVFATVALAGLVQSVTALVTTSVYTHTDRFVDTKDMTIHLIPSVRVHIEAEAFRELLSSLAVYLCPWYAFSFEDGLSIVKLRSVYSRGIGGFAAEG